MAYGRSYGAAAMEHAAKKKHGPKRHKAAPFVQKRPPGEVSDVRSSNPGTKGVEGQRAYPSKGGYQIPYSQDTGRNPYRRGTR